jgi:hypothetical protein
MNSSSRMLPASTSARGRQAEKIVGRLINAKDYSVYLGTVRTTEAYKIRLFSVNGTYTLRTCSIVGVEPLLISLTDLDAAAGRFACERWALR